MPQNVTVPFFKPGQDVTGYVADDAGVNGRHFVAPVAGGRGGQPHIGPAGAGVSPLGVAGHDQLQGQYVHVNVGGIVPVIAGADVTAGQSVEVGAGGTAVPLASGVRVGLAVGNAPAGTAVPVKLSI